MLSLKSKNGPSLSWALDIGFPYLLRLFIHIHSAVWIVDKLWEMASFITLQYKKIGKCGQCSVLNIPADTQTEQELKCDAWSRDFCLGTVEGIIGTCQSDFPLNLPGLISLGYRKLFHFHTVFWWNACDTDTSPCQSVWTALVLNNRYPRESLRRKEAQIASWKKVLYFQKATTSTHSSW